MKKNKNYKSKAVVKHLKSDIKTFKKEAAEDVKLMKKLKSPKHHSKKKDPKPKGKIEKVMHEFKEGALHSGSKKGPEVKSRKQAIAIGLSEARKAGEAVKPKKKKRK